MYVYLDEDAFLWLKKKTKESIYKFEMLQF